ncbi:Spy/CpxP family protein refolding chaperone [Pseudoalteromonas tunicata]|jgi:protein CpxP|uniref:Periplasmic heavy metal sensor n=2 Tax=Pseudoalteromonas tunicata TaxID=314281 RepID=A4C794_9GAMM|nr:Spy/CpxP family protein refolding chaperone [Pseudoalteromonas tunicata]ATC95818.1 hypothetical protein PTUN_a3503 [Pseudoalteromonas tunicata]AXT31364.1 hypothetical protein D1819_11425 [Pseudoalteromonas tunicata]EAR29848.1 hypothetical protein PTD2_13549 [Pseudoalteromonas tunicata D2]
MKLSQLVMIAGLSAATLFSTASMAKPDHDMFRFLQSEKAAKRLELTDSQQAQIAAIATLSKADLSPFKDVMKSNKDQTKAIVHAAQFDEAAFRSVMQGNQAEMLEMAVIHARYNNQVWNVLTPEQQEKLGKMRKHMQKK